MTRRYFLYSLIYIIIVLLIVFSLNNQNFTLSSFGYELTLPIVAWFAIPLVLLMILSMFHMMVYSIKNFFATKAVKNDSELFDTFAKEIFLGLDSNKELKTPYFNSCIACLHALNPWGNNPNINFKNENLQLAFDIFCKVKNGEVADLKHFKLLKNNPLYIQNEINKIKQDLKYAISIFNQKDKISDAMQDTAREQIIQKATYSQIEKFSLKYSFNEVKILITRHVQKEIELKGEELLSVLNSGDFSADEYLQCAKILKKKISPDSLISIFKQLKSEHSACMEAYLYLLYDLQMIEELRQALLACEGEHFERIEALLFLREHGRTAKADFIYNL